jgi:hypothetical protein
MEATGVALTSEQIDNFLVEAFRIIEAVPAHFLSNLDEMGHQEWTDRKVISCVVRRFHEGDHVNFPLAWTGQRITFMACITWDDHF